MYIVFSFVKFDEQNYFFFLYLANYIGGNYRFFVFLTNPENVIGLLALLFR
jgi:hypothetical protein